MRDLGRLITAMVTPFDKKGQVNYAQAKRLAKALLASGSDGLVVSGTTGESPTLTKDEKLKLFAAVRQAIGKKVTLIAGTGSNNTQESIDFTHKVEKQGIADAVLVVVPYYNRTTQDGVYAHFKAIAQSTKLPCILYNVPTRTVTNMAVETTIRLSAIPNIIGIKEAAPDVKQAEAIIKGVTRKDFRVWSGDDGNTHAIVSAGGYGVVAVASHLVGKQMREMIERDIKGDQAGAQAIHDRLTPIFKDLYVVPNPIPIKYAMNYLGFDVGGLRLPLFEIDEKNAATVRDALAKVTIDLPLKKKAR